jgi:hypothetical protein
LRLVKEKRAALPLACFLRNHPIILFDVTAKHKPTSISSPPACPYLYDCGPTTPGAACKDSVVAWEADAPLGRLCCLGEICNRDQCQGLGNFVSPGVKTV